MSRKRKSFTIEEKCSIIRMLEEGRRNVDIQKQYGLSSSSIATIWKNREYFRGLLNLNCKKIKRRRKCSYIEIEKMLLDWIKKEEVNCSERTKIPVLLLKANEFALQKGIDFIFTKSWIQRFRVRNGFSSINTSNEADDKSDFLKDQTAYDAGLKCRLCLIDCTEKKSVPLFENSIASKWIELISRYLNIKLTDNDSYSLVICPKCAQQLSTFNSFSSKVEQCQRILESAQNMASFSACHEESDTIIEEPMNIKTEQFDDLTEFEIQDLPEELNCNSLEEAEETIYSSQHSTEEDPISFKKTLKTEKTLNKFWKSKDIEEKEDNTCEICNVALKNVPTLISHYQHMHKDYKDFQFYTCKVCGLQFSKERVFQHHLAKSKKCSEGMETT